MHCSCIYMLAWLAVFALVVGMCALQAKRTRHVCCHCIMSLGFVRCLMFSMPPGNQCQALQYTVKQALLQAATAAALQLPGIKVEVGLERWRSSSINSWDGECSLHVACGQSTTTRLAYPT
jgi:hypothetical protein